MFVAVVYPPAECASLSSSTKVHWRQREYHFSRASDTCWHLPILISNVPLAYVLHLDDLRPSSPRNVNSNTEIPCQPSTQPTGFPAFSRSASLFDMNFEMRREWMLFKFIWPLANVSDRPYSITEYVATAIIGLAFLHRIYSTRWQTHTKS